MKIPNWQIGAIVLFGANVMCAPSFGQDPFGFDTPTLPASDGDAAGSNSNTESTSNGTSLGITVEPDERNAVVLSLRSNPPKTSKDLGRALLLMTRIGRWDEAAYWLEQADKFGINEATASQMISTAGTQTLLRLLSPDTNITAPQRGEACSKRQGSREQQQSGTRSRLSELAGSGELRCCCVSEPCAF
jgi:hypothetical protein